jgi:probable rRNA maturation factor
MMFEVDVQVACDEDDLPDVDNVRSWARATVEEFRDHAELSVRIVGESESARLNTDYRHVSGSTNVLSFPFEPPPGVQLPLLGDVVICAPVVRREAREQKKATDAHLAHMVVHGTLHLLGFDHQEKEDAERMEAAERRILAKLGFDNPYVLRGRS